MNFHVWEPYEVKLQAENNYSNPYAEVEIWVELKGPGFDKRVYGFWDGGNTFKVRILASNTGKWVWTSGSNQNDLGLNGKTGGFTALDWTEAEKKKNNCRRGMIQASQNGHGLQYSDGTQAFLLGDTWYSAGTFRYKWAADDEKHPKGPEMGFKDMVQLRKEQGYNCVAIIASFPVWANDGYPFNLNEEDGTCIRSAWRQQGTDSAKDMYNEGGRAFEFPGKVPGYENVVPDLDRINPEYFKHLDLKISYLNENGFTPIIEVARRDISQVWKKYHNWPVSYARYIQYVFSRYQANNCILSPIHYDYHKESVPAEDYNEAANLIIDRFGHPPFGTLLTANASMTTLLNFGGPEKAKWLTLHQLANFRQHEYYWYLTDLYRSAPARPAINGEPYYPYEGHGGQPMADDETQNSNSRSGLYGSFLSGGLAGYIYGAEGMWGADIEAGTRFKMWETIQLESGRQIPYIKEFFKGICIQNLIPSADLVLPNTAGNPTGYTGWAYCARTVEKDTFLFYFEKECPLVLIRGLLPDRTYHVRWFNPRNGLWHVEAGFETMTADMFGRFSLPLFPSEEDWGLAATLAAEVRTDHDDDAETLN